MRDYIEIGSSPSDEDCVQVGSENYMERSRKECSLFKEQLEEQFPDGEFVIKSFPHDFGTYHDVVAYYDTDDDESPGTIAAFAAESSAWPRWTPEKKMRLPLPLWPV